MENKLPFILKFEVIVNLKHFYFETSEFKDYKTLAKYKYLRKVLVF